MSCYILENHISEIQLWSTSQECPCHTNEACMPRHKAFSLYPLVSTASPLYLLVSPPSSLQKAEAQWKLRISRHTESVFVVSQVTVSCWLGLPECSRLEKQKIQPELGLALSLTASAGCLQDAFCSAGILFLQLGQQTKQKHSLLWCNKCGKVWRTTYNFFF